MWHVWGRELLKHFTLKYWKRRPLENPEVRFEDNIKMEPKCTWSCPAWAVVTDMTWKDRRDCAATSPAAVSGVQPNYSVAGVFVSWNSNGSIPSTSGWLSPQQDKKFRASGEKKNRMFITVFAKAASDSHRDPYMSRPRLRYLSLFIYYLHYYHPVYAAESE
jgi:hypothetical protein